MAAEINGAKENTGKENVNINEATEKKDLFHRGNPHLFEGGRKHQKSNGAAITSTDPGPKGEGGKGKGSARRKK